MLKFSAEGAEKWRKKLEEQTIKLVKEVGKLEYDYAIMLERKGNEIELLKIANKKYLLQKLFFVPFLIIVNCIELRKSINNLNLRSKSFSLLSAIINLPTRKIWNQVVKATRIRLKSFCKNYVQTFVLF